jgi:hypothetical protein
VKTHFNPRFLSLLGLLSETSSFLGGSGNHFGSARVLLGNLLAVTLGTVAIALELLTIVLSFRFGCDTSTVELGTVMIAFENDAGLGALTLVFEAVAEIDTVGIASTDETTTLGSLVIGIFDMEEDVVEGVLAFDLSQEGLERILNKTVKICDATRK